MVTSSFWDQPPPTNSSCPRLTMRLKAACIAGVCLGHHISIHFVSLQMKRRLSSASSACVTVVRMLETESWFSEPS